MTRSEDAVRELPQFVEDSGTWGLSSYLAEVTTFALKKMDQWESRACLADFPAEELTKLWEARHLNLKNLGDLNARVPFQLENTQCEPVVEAVWDTYATLVQFYKCGSRLLLLKPTISYSRQETLQRLMKLAGVPELARFFPTISTFIEVRWILSNRFSAFTRVAGVRTLERLKELMLLRSIAAPEKSPTWRILTSTPTRIQLWFAALGFRCGHAN